jgi:hypothetical protein
MASTFTKFVIVDPHVSHYKKILSKYLKKEKNYFRYGAFLDYLLERDLLILLNTKSASSFKRPLLRRFFLSKTFNTLEFYLWLKINKLNADKIPIIYDLNEVNPQSTIVFDLAATWNPQKAKYLQDLENYDGIVAVHLTHYFRNTTNIFNTLPKLKHLFVVSEGTVTNTKIFKKFYSTPVQEVCMPFVIDHLNTKFLESKILPSNKRQKKCLMMGSHQKHGNDLILETYDTTFLHPDRAFFRFASEDLEYFEYEPKNISPTKSRRFKLISKYLRGEKLISLDLLYSKYQVFFTGVEIVGAPSMNVFEGMYFGCVYIGPDDSLHKNLGFIDKENYISYKSGSFESFLYAVSSLLDSTSLIQKISENGKNFVRSNFYAEKVYSEFIENLTQSKQAL